MSLSNVSLQTTSTSNSQPTLNIYATLNIVANKSSNLTGRKVWLSANNVFINDKINISNNINDITTTGGLEQSDYHIGLIADNEMLINSPVTIRGSSIIMNAKGKMILETPII